MPDKTLQPVAEKAPENGKIRMKLICPMYSVATLEADSVLLPAAEGDILILPNRAPIFFNLRPGRMVVYNKGQKPVNFLVSAGICEVRRNLCPVLAWGEQEDKIDVEQVKKQLEKAHKSLSDYRTDLGKTEASSRVEYLEMVLKELNADTHSK